MMDNIQAIEKPGQFDEALQADKPVLAEFYAEWCGHCKRLAPKLSELAQEFADSVRFIKIDIDKASELVDRHEVNKTPTVLLFEGGRLTHSWVGEEGQEPYRRILEAVSQRSASEG